MENNGYNLVYEKDEIINSIKMNAINDNYIIDYFDFNTNSFEEFIDYLDFIEYDSYTFISIYESNRLDKIISFLSNALPNIYFKRISLTEFLQKENLKIDNETYKQIEVLENTNTEEILNRGFLSFMTGRYPIEIPRGVIKHVLIDEGSNISKISDSLLNKFAINSCIYVKKNIVNSECLFPIIVKDYYYFDKNNDLEAKEIKDIELMLNVFIETGKIEDSKSLIKSFDYITGISNFNSLTIGDSKYYIDPIKKYYIGDLSDEYINLHNSLSNTVDSNLFLKNYDRNYLFMFLLYTNVFNMELNIKKMITPFNKNILSVKNYNAMYLNWVAFIDNQSDIYLYNITGNRLFKINQYFLEIFEYIIKDENTEMFSKDINKVREILNEKND
ncbi:hypothetical protein ACN68I_07130 [Aerococcus viridans]|uniref:hypothetical protein n=1 Tax=Aerococcus viridans TaxID=1377 RepID=UPI003B21117D